MKRWARWIALPAAVFLIASCGGGDDDAGLSKVQKRSIVASAPPLKEVLVTSAQINDQPAGSAQRAFLTYWSDLQYEAWANAASAYDPPLQRALGLDRITEGLKAQAAFYRSARPQLRGTSKEDGRTTIRYTVKNADGEEIPRSITWVRGGGWKIFYDPTLDDGLAQAARAKVQTAVDPTAQKPSKSALRAADEASRLQSRYLRDRLGANAPTTSQP